MIYSRIWRRASISLSDGDNDVRNFMPTKEEIVKNIQKDINYYSSGQLHAFEASGVITWEDLQEVFRNDQIGAIIEGISLCGSETVVNEPTGKPEIYFWGVTDSGKTCAIDAILNILRTKGIRLPNDYFENVRPYQVKYGYVVIPSKSNEEGIHVLNLETANAKGNKPLVSVIEVSGKVCNAIHKAKCGIELSDKEKREIEQVKRFVEKRSSTKIHFITAEYNYTRENFQDMNAQESILISIVDFLDRERFFKDTVCVYVLVTKCDKIPNADVIFSDPLLSSRDDTTPRRAYEYVREYLPNFWLRLSQICKRKHIRNVRTVSFSVGKVFAQDLCRFDGRDAEKVIKLIESTVSRPNIFVLLWERLFKKSKMEQEYL